MKINWDAAGVIATIGIAAVAGIWTVYTYFKDADPSTKDSDKVPKPAVTLANVPAMRVCRADSEGKCSPHDRFIGCTELNDWQKSACKQAFQVVAKDSDIAGGHCGYALYRVKCLE